MIENKCHLNYQVDGHLVISQSNTLQISKIKPVVSYHSTTGLDQTSVTITNQTGSPLYSFHYQIPEGNFDYSSNFIPKNGSVTITYDKTMDLFPVLIWYHFKKNGRLNSVYIFNKDFLRQMVI